MRIIFLSIGPLLFLALPEQTRLERLAQVPTTWQKQSLRSTSTWATRGDVTTCLSDVVFMYPHNIMLLLLVNNCDNSVPTRGANDEVDTRFHERSPRKVKKHPIELLWLLDKQWPFQIYVSWLGETSEISKTDATSTTMEERTRGGAYTYLHDSHLTWADNLWVLVSVGFGRSSMAAVSWCRPQSSWRCTSSWKTTGQLHIHEN